MTSMFISIRLKEFKLEYGKVILGQGGKTAFIIRYPNISFISMFLPCESCRGRGLASSGSRLVISSPHCDLGMFWSRNQGNKTRRIRSPFTPPLQSVCHGWLSVRADVGYLALRHQRPCSACSLCCMYRERTSLAFSYANKA